MSIFAKTFRSLNPFIVSTVPSQMNEIFSIIICDKKYTIKQSINTRKISSRTLTELTVHFLIISVWWGMVGPPVVSLFPVKNKAMSATLIPLTVLSCQLIFVNFDVRTRNVNKIQCLQYVSYSLHSIKKMGYIWRGIKTIPDPSNSTARDCAPGPVILGSATEFRQEYFMYMDMRERERERERERATQIASNRWVNVG